MRAGKTVITVHSAPSALGIASNPTVQAWIGANVKGTEGGPVVTVDRDPILGDIPVGTQILNCGASGCGSLNDTSGHPQAKVLARFVFHPEIAIMRNIWEGGVSVYLTWGIHPGHDTLHDQIWLNAVQARQLIPTVSGWGLLALGLGVTVAGAVVIRRRGSLARSRFAFPALLVATVFAACAT